MRLWKKLTSIYTFPDREEVCTFFLSFKPESPEANRIILDGYIELDRNKFANGALRVKTICEIVE